MSFSGTDNPSKQVKASWRANGLLYNPGQLKAWLRSKGLETIES